MAICLAQSANHLYACNGPADSNATTSSLASLKSRMVLPFWCRLTWVVLERGPLNGCCCCLEIGFTVRVSVRVSKVRLGFMTRG